MERKAEVQKQLVAAGNVRQRIPADTQRLPGSRSANLTPTPTKVNHPAPKSAFMCRMPEFSSEYFDDLPAYILDTETMLMGINRKNRNVNDYNRAISGN